jgi:hypothetical protein
MCWKAVKLMKRSGLGGSRIPAHNVDHAMLQQKEEAINGRGPGQAEGSTGRRVLTWGI